MNRTMAKSKIDDISTLKLRYRASATKGCVPAWKLWKYETACIVNNYPKEWLIHEVEKDPIIGLDLGDLVSFEPLWKIIIANKAILPLLWAMYPNHPNLLPAYYDDPEPQFSNFNSEFRDKNWVSKPLFGREGLGVFFSKNYTSYR